MGEDDKSKIIACKSKSEKEIMATSIPIQSSAGVLTTNTLTTIYFSQATGQISKIWNIKFTPNDVTTPYNIKFYISINSGATDILIYNRDGNGGDSINDDTVYFLSNNMRLKVLVDIANLLNYTITGELITP